MQLMRKYEYLGVFNITVIFMAISIIMMFITTNSIVLASILPVNDGIFETGKLMFISILIYSIIEYYIFGKRFKNFFFSKLSTLIFAPLIFVYLTYTFDKFIGSSIALTHVFTFILALTIGQYLSYIMLAKLYHFKLMNLFAVIAILLMYGFYASFSLTNKGLIHPVYQSMTNYEDYILNHY